jgi:uncharacterized protein DUF932
MNDTRVSHEWASRPADQRFLTIADLLAAVKARRLDSAEESVALDRMRLAPEGGELALTTGGASHGLLSHWAFGQMCSRAKAPAGYLRTLPAELAAINLQWSLETREDGNSDEGNDAKILSRGGKVSAVTSTTYGRIWDLDVVRAVADHIDLSVWRVPSASYQARDPKRATTLYGSDRDVFMFLVDEGRPIEAGDGDSLRRGFYVWNSEVGASTFGIRTFTYDYVCDNRIIWGQSNVREVTVRHTSGGPHRFRSVVPQITAYAKSSDREMVDTIRAAKAKRVGATKKDVVDWLAARGFTKPLATKAYEAAANERRGYDPRSVWGLVQGLTETARDIAHTDARVELEEKAGSLLEKLAA